MASSTSRGNAQPPALVLAVQSLLVSLEQRWQAVAWVATVQVPVEYPPPPEQARTPLPQAAPPT